MDEIPICVVNDMGRVFQGELMGVDGSSAIVRNYETGKEWTCTWGETLPITKTAVNLWKALFEEAYRYFLLEHHKRPWAVFG